MPQHRDSFRDTFTRNIRIRAFLRCKLYLKSADQVGDWFPPKDAFQHRHDASKGAKSEEKTEGARYIFYFHGDLACPERARIPAFIDLCRASFYLDPLCIEVFYLVHYLAHLHLQPGMVPRGKHSARNERAHFFFVVDVLFERAWMQLFKILHSVE